MRILFSFFGLAWLASVSSAQVAAEGEATTVGTAITTTADYLLTTGDQIAVSVQGENDFSTEQPQVIDSKGIAKLPHLGAVALSGKSLRDAEAHVEAALTKSGFLKKPQVTITITAYSPREVRVSRQVKTPATIQFPRDTTSLDIVDVIYRAGGFTSAANTNEVLIGRKQPDGTERQEIVDVERLLKVDTRKIKIPERVLVYPGDRVWVKIKII